MGILDEQSKLNPKYADLLLSEQLFSECTNYAPLLEKLEKEHSVISIKQRPDKDGISEADHELFESEQPKNYKCYMSYIISLSFDFDKFYKSEYVKNRSTAATLTANNRELVIDVMKAIDDEISITGNTKVSIDPVQGDEMSHKALAFLKRLGAISKYETIDDMYFDDDYAKMMPSGNVDTFKIEIILPAFDEVFTELDSANKTNGKPSTSSPVAAPIEYDDEHATATYQDKTEKLFDTGTIMSVLTHRVLNADGARINATDVLLEIETLRIDNDREKTTKTLTNAKDRINNRFEKLFKIESVICYERQQFWLNIEYVSPQSPYKVKKIGKKAIKK